MTPKYIIINSTVPTVGGNGIWILKPLDEIRLSSSLAKGSRGEKSGIMKSLMKMDFFSPFSTYLGDNGVVWYLLF